MDSTDSPEHSTLKIDTLPNRLTAVRIACVPLVVVSLMFDSPRAGFISALIFGLAGLTDYFDGYYARLQKSSTVIGQLLDPLADKFLVVSSLIMLMQLHRIDAVIVIVLICREMAITGLRSIAAAEGIVIGASRMAKWKTATQMTAIPMLMLHEKYFFINMQKLGNVFVWLSLLISLWSAKDYIVDFFKALKNKSEERKQIRLAKRALKRDRKRLARENRAKKSPLN